MCAFINVNRNDILRAKGILPPKDEKREDELEDEFVDLLKAREAERNSLENKDLDELDELEDLEDDRILLEYRLMNKIRLIIAIYSHID